MSGATLEGPDPHHIFYIKKYWSNYGVGSVILHAGDSIELLKLEAQE